MTPEFERSTFCNIMHHKFPWLSWERAADIAKAAQEFFGGEQRSGPAEASRSNDPDSRDDPKGPQGMDDGVRAAKPSESLRLLSALHYERLSVAERNELDVAASILEGVGQ